MLIYLTAGVSVIIFFVLLCQINAFFWLQLYAEFNFIPLSTIQLHIFLQSNYKKPAGIDQYRLSKEKILTKTKCSLWYSL